MWNGSHGWNPRGTGQAIWRGHEQSPEPSARTSSRGAPPTARPLFGMDKDTVCSTMVACGGTIRPRGHQPSD